MAIQKTSVTYIYSKESDVAKYLEFLVDKIRKLEYLELNIICTEDYKKSAAAIEKMESSLATRIKSKDYEVAMDERSKLNRFKIANKYRAVSPAFIINEGLEEELTILGTKKSLSGLLDILTKVTDAAEIFSSIDMSAVESTIRVIGKAAINAAMSKENAGEGLETTQEHT